jgi:hypothetical protein
MQHPLSLAIYELCESGVQVTTQAGRVGVYDSAGHWASGEKFAVDKHMCEWIGDGPREVEDISNNRRFRSIIQEEKTL